MAPHDVMRKSCCREFSRKTSRLPVLLLFFGSPASAPLQICFLNHHFCEFISTDLFVLQFSFSVFESGDFQDIILLPDILPYIKRLSCYLLWIFFALQILLVVLIFFLFLHWSPLSFAPKQWITVSALILFSSGLGEKILLCGQEGIIISNPKAFE